MLHLRFLEKWLDFCSHRVTLAEPAQIACRCLNSPRDGPFARSFELRYSQNETDDVTDVPDEEPPPPPAHHEPLMVSAH